MINLVNKMCGHPKCSKRATFGMTGSNEMEMCAEHASNGMINVVGKRCLHQDCLKHPSFGWLAAKAAKCVQSMLWTGW